MASAAYEKLKAQAKALEAKPAPVQEHIEPMRDLPAVVPTEPPTGLAVTDDPELAQLFTESASYGAEHLQNELPMLKVHSTGKSTTNVLADGSEPKDGSFFYKPTKTEYDDIVCHILTISRGFRSDGVQDKKNVYNQILAGVILNDGDMKPFLMYMTGTKLQNMWAFGKEAHRFTKAKPVPIPMFALTVHLTTRKEKHAYGMGWVIDFELMMSDERTPMIETDKKAVTMLRNSIPSVQETIDSIIASKSTEDQAEEYPPESLNGEEVVNPKDIPF